MPSHHKQLIVLNLNCNYINLLKIPWETYHNHSTLTRELSPPSVIQYGVLTLSGVVWALAFPYPASTSIASHHSTLQIMSRMDKIVGRGFTPPSLWRNSFFSHRTPSWRQALHRNAPSIALKSQIMTLNSSYQIIPRIHNKRFTVTSPSPFGPKFVSHGQTTM